MVKLIKFDETGATEHDVEIYTLVVKIANQYGVDPSGSIESEEFFRKLLYDYTGDLNDLPSWLEDKIMNHFIAINERPKWLQNASWPFSNGKPMIFVKQIDLSPYLDGTISNIYRDDTSLYIFIGKDTPPIVITQQM